MCVFRSLFSYISIYIYIDKYIFFLFFKNPQPKNATRTPTQVCVCLYTYVLLTEPSAPAGSRPAAPPRCPDRSRRPGLLLISICIYIYMCADIYIYIYLYMKTDTRGATSRDFYRIFDHIEKHDDPKILKTYDARHVEKSTLVAR